MAKEPSTAGGYARRYLRTVAELDRLQTMLKTIEKPDWRRQILGPMARRLCQLARADGWRVAGPFGLGSQAHIELVFGKTGRKRMQTLTVSPYNLEKGQLCVVTDEQIEKFPPGSIGALNGLGRRKIPIALGAPLANLLPLFKNARYCADH